MLRAIAVVGSAFFLVGCDVPVEDDAVAPPPGKADSTDDDGVSAIGAPDTLEIATWNLRNFPATDETVNLTAELVSTIDLDVIAVQEIADEDAFWAMVDQLPEHDAVLSEHVYSSGVAQKVGLVYRADLVTVTNASLLFQDSGWEFPRPPMEILVEVDGRRDFELRIIVVHLKAGFHWRDRWRREKAVALLDEHIADDADVDATVVVGDFNEVVTSDAGRDALDPFLDDARYAFATKDLALDGGVSFLPTKVVLDHIVRTAQPDDDRDWTVVIPRLDEQVRDYKKRVSDHLPATLVTPLADLQAPPN